MGEADTWNHRAAATARGGRVQTDDGAFSSRLSSPLAPPGSGLTPEHLLAAAFATCLHHAAAEAATEITNEPHTVEVHAETRLRRDPDGRYRAEVRASVSSCGLSPDQLSALVNRADQLWPFSSSGDVRHALHVVAGRVEENQPQAQLS
ncbi:OsmC family protein [Solwaraspora sp. WMMD406]|uniref:OsmC family protein n=1 Tax=Solwaraspora sp. WMMD406 TaxID=3016095 RepID=UPI0024178BB2|nr:OsmC family protein [Solwaraspora sp. WMMD406]MDG4766301.1 OsmC family protein [Solwaraspora sp. WMMD406]